MLAIELDPYAFACDGPFLGVPHGANVLTNLPFLAIGLWGLRRLRATGGTLASDANRLGLWVSVALLAFGSGAYHLWLTPGTLAADRLCIAGILAFTVAEALAVAWPGLRRPAVTWGLLAATEASVLLWWTGLASSLWYGALQAVGAVAVVVVALRARRAGRLPPTALPAIVGFVAFYAVAKVVEVLDEPICHATGFLGGHPLKHLFSAAGVASLLPWLGESTRPVLRPVPGTVPNI